MKVSEHITYGGVASAVLFPFFGTRTIFFFLGSIFIDLDHYIDFLYYGKFKNWSIPKMFKFHGTLSKWVELYPVLAIEAFHTIEFLMGWFFVATFFKSTELYLTLAGMVLHLALDLARLKQRKLMNVRALSFFEYWVRSKKMIAKNGDHPEKIFCKAYEIIS